MTEIPRATIFGVSFDPATKRSRVFGSDDLERELGDSSVFSWIDVESSDIEALNVVLRLVDVDLVLVGHFDRPEVLPRIIERHDCLAFYLYEVCNPERHLDITREIVEIEFARLLVVLGPDYVITYHRRRLEGVDYVKSVCEESFALAGQTPNFIAFLFMHRCLYDYAHVNLANDNFIDALEEGLLLGTHGALQARIGVAGANILTLKRLATSLHIVLMLLASKHSRFVSEPARISYGEILQNALSVRASIDSSRDLLDGVVGTLQAQAANRTSEIARVLTVVSTIILPLSLLAGVYGMNFRVMPELESEWGYYIVLASMGLIAAGLLGVFYRLGWIGRSRSSR